MHHGAEIEKLGILITISGARAYNNTTHAVHGGEVQGAGEGLAAGDPGRDIRVGVPRRGAGADGPVGQREDDAAEHPGREGRRRRRRGLHLLQRRALLQVPQAQVT